MRGKLAVFPLLGLAFLGLTQCQNLSLDMRKSGTLPRVEMEGVYFQEVVDACAEVLVAHGYHLTMATGPRLVYEKPGSTMDFLAWGGFSLEDELVERLSLYVRELGADTFEVECQPFIVTRVGSYMEEARKISRLKAGKYQALLEEVKARASSGIWGEEDALSEWH